MATARKTIHARPRHLGKIHNRPRFDGVFDAVTITVYYWKKYQAYLVLIGDKVLLSLVSMKSKKLLLEYIYLLIFPGFSSILYLLSSFVATHFGFYRLPFFNANYVLNTILNFI